MVAVETDAIEQSKLLISVADFTLIEFPISTVLGFV
jgi:hypothetical protein